MRIRSIKPEFWRSDDITTLSIEDRLLFIGMWSYVDDNGVGLDKLAAITADLFAGDLEHDPRETFARVSRGLQNLSDHGRIVRYTVNGKDYLAVTNWSKHQRIDKPNKPRFPQPDAENSTIRDTLPTPSRHPRETPAPGTEEQGNRGTGEQNKRAASGDDAALDSTSTPIEQTITASAYEAVGGAFNFIAVRQIVKWAIHSRGESPDRVHDAVLTVYEMGKPITKQTIGQHLDGRLAAPRSSDRQADILRREMAAAVEADNTLLEIEQ